MEINLFVVGFLINIRAKLLQPSKIFVEIGQYRYYRLHNKLHIEQMFSPVAFCLQDYIFEPLPQLHLGCEAVSGPLPSVNDVHAVIVILGSRKHQQNFMSR